MNDDLFETTQEPIDPEKDYFSELVGDGKKYKDQLAAGRAIVEKDAHIDRLETEMAALRQDLNSRVTLEELMTKLSSNQTPPAQPNPAALVETPPAGTLTPDAVDKLLDEKLANAREMDRRKNNTDSVRVELEKLFGKGYANRLKEISAELNVGPKFLNDLAGVNPKAFLALVSGKARQEGITGDVTTPPQSSVVQPFAPNTERRYSYFEKIRKENPRLYWTTKVQNELHRESQRQGADFFDVKI